MLVGIQWPELAKGEGCPERCKTAIRAVGSGVAPTIYGTPRGRSHKRCITTLVRHSPIVSIVSILGQRPFLLFRADRSQRALSGNVGRYQL